MRLLKIGDLASFPDDVPSGPVRYELHDGRLVISGAATYDHSTASTALMFQLALQGDRRGHGQTTGRVAIVLRTNPDHLLVPDVTHRRNERCPPRLTEEGYLLTIPDLLVEVLERDETAEATQWRVDDYIFAGAACVWVVDPRTKRVTETRRGGRRVYDEVDVLTLDDIIPGFSLPVRDVFADRAQVFRSRRASS